MTNEKTVGGNQTPEQPSPQLQAVPGYQTTSGQFTAIFTLVALILSLLGFHYSPEQIEGWVNLVEKILLILGPILASVPVLMTYINSRGKIASNTLNANSHVLSSQPPLIDGVAGQIVELKSDGLSGFLGGDSWKDPERYANLLEIGKQLGVPGAKEADAVNQQTHASELITGILGMLHKKRTDV